MFLPGKRLTNLIPQLVSLDTYVLQWRTYEDRIKWPEYYIILIKIVKPWLKFYLNLFLWIQLTLRQIWFEYGLVRLGYRSSLTYDISINWLTHTDLYIYTYLKDSVELSLHPVWYSALKLQWETQALNDVINIVSRIHNKLIYIYKTGQNWENRHLSQ